MRLLAFALLVPALAAGGTPSLALIAPRAAHTATLLPTGQVLVVGGCAIDSCELDDRGATTELYNPGERRFVAGPRLSTPRVGHVAARLPDGRVLVVGGWTPSGLSRTAELYEHGRFRLTGNLLGVRGGATATPLHDGRVLVAGGTQGDGVMLARAELYDPGSGRFTAVAPMRVGRGGHVAVRLLDGRILIVGGFDGRRVLRSTELYDPRRATFAPGPRLRLPRHKHAAVVLRDGRVLVLGGSNELDFRGRYASAELLDVRAGRSLRVAPMRARRFKLPDAAVLLRDGSVLVAGGAAQLERFEPRRARFVAAGRIDDALAFATATRLRDGRVLVVGGYDERLTVSRRAWLVQPSR